MKTYSIVYSSKTGNTKLLAEEIKNMQIKDMECIYCGAPEKKAIEADIIFCGFWTDKGRCDDEIAKFLQQCEKKEVFLFGTAGFGGEEVYFNQILDRVKSYIKPSNQVIGTFMCQGKMPESVKARYEQMLLANPEDEKSKMLLDNYEKALSHPDKDDLSRFHESLKVSLYNK